MRLRLPMLASRRRRAHVSHQGNGHGEAPHARVAEVALKSGPLDDIERELIEWFVDFTALMGVPASIGQIYGLLYLSGRPLPFEHFVDRLGISKGSASQGLKFLRGLGAVHVVAVRGDRREFYEAEISPTRLVSGFLGEKVLPRLRNSGERLSKLEKHLQENGAVDPVLSERVRRLHIWNQRARQFLPVVAGLVKFRT